MSSNDDLDDIAESADAALGIARRALDKINDLEDDVDRLEDELEDAEAELDALRERTDLVQAVQKASNLKPEERAVVCIQTLYNRANARQDVGEPPLAEMTARQAITALGGSINRTAVYRTFETADDLLSDIPDDVFEYRTEDRSSAEKSRLRLNLDAGDLPSVVAGHDIVVGGSEVAGQPVDSAVLGGER
jgi:hypothetical protein